MKFNQNTLRTIAEGGHMPDQEYVMEMAKALLKEVFIIPRLDGDKRPDGSPQWYDVFKEGVKRAEIYHASTINAYTIETNRDSDSWCTYNSLEECAAVLEVILK